jgi:hypothetical protein
VEIESFDEVKRAVTIEGTPGELEAIVEELKRWQPTGGWSRDVQKLFNALEGD